MSEHRINRPEWYFHGLLVSWRLWAVGSYEARRSNWTFRFFALGPFRVRFARLLTKIERTPNTKGNTND